MPLPQKNYFFLPEIAERWGATVTDLGTYAHEGLLTLCAMAINAHVETGAFEASSEGRGIFIPTGHAVLNGPQPLFPEQVWSILQNRIDVIDHFRSLEPPGRSNLAEGVAPLRLSLHQLLVTRAERDRFEGAYDLRIEPSPEQKPIPAFVHDPDYAEVTLLGECFRLGPAQASVVRELHAAAQRGDPWLHQHELMQRCARSARVVDLFKSQTRWRLLISFNGRGFCRLNLPEETPSKARRRAFRRAVWARNAERRNEAVDNVR